MGFKQINSKGARIGFSDNPNVFAGNAMFIHQKQNEKFTISAAINQNRIGKEAQVVLCDASPCKMYINQGDNERFITGKSRLLIPEIVIAYMETHELAFLITVSGVSQWNNGIYYHVATKKEDIKRVKQSFLNQTYMLSPHVTALFLEEMQGRQLENENTKNDEREDGVDDEE